MGLIKAALGSAGGVLADTWKDYFVCDALANEVLMVKGTKKGAGLFDKSDVITNGSGIVVADGQCALIVDDGLVVEVANEPGNYTFNTDKSPSIFDGGLTGLKDTFSTMVERFTYGGVTNRSQTVYYVNTKEIMGYMYGTATPVSFRVKDDNVGYDIDVGLRCNGEYSIKITNPILFYKNVAGNCTQFTRDQLDNQMKTELLTALQPALADLSNKGVNRYSDIPMHTFDLVDSLNAILSKKWSDLRGISICSFGINSISPTDDDLKRIQNLQEGAALRNPNAAAGAMAAAQAQAMRDAANNPGGAMGAFMGMNMAAGAGNVAGLFAQGQPAAGGTGTFCPHCGKPVAADAAFCSSCGKPLK